MTLSDSRAVRCPSSIVGVANIDCTGLSRLPGRLSRRAVLTTPADQSGCMCRLLLQIMLPSPSSDRVDVHNFPFEACSSFIRITARRFARSPKVILSQGFSPDDRSSKPPANYRANRPLPEWDLHPLVNHAIRDAPEGAEVSQRSQRNKGAPSAQKTSASTAHPPRPQR